MDALKSFLFSFFPFLRSNFADDQALSTNENMEWKKTHFLKNSEAVKQKALRKNEKWKQFAKASSAWL